MKKIIHWIALLQLLMINGAWADQAFVVKNIEVTGVEGISPSAVESYLPIKRGQVLSSAKTSTLLRSLYQTGFFDQINLSREGNTLVIHVVERPTIGQLKVTGNSVIATDKLTPVLTSLDIAEGRVYNPAVLERVRQSLLNQYYQLGRYNAQVNTYVTPMSRHRVAVKIDISEGLVAKIQRITVIGNKVFKEKTLVNQLDITTSGLVTIITGEDRYSEDKLDESSDKIRNYYLDHGYLHAEVQSAQAEVTPDRKSVYITFVVTEGLPYTIEKYNVTGDLLLSPAELKKDINIQPGETFSRQKLIDAEKAISDDLGSKGYLFANVSIHPQVNEATRQVAVTFNISSGKRTYVRHITFSQNSRTNDVALRRELVQMEAAPASTKNLDESKHRLSLLPFIKNVDMAMQRIPGVDDQVDVNYKVEEDNSAQASFKVGYSQLYRTILGVGLNQKNVLGTGNTLGINFQRSKYEQYYGVDYTNPYYTADGISRSFNFAISRTDPAGAGVNVGYTTQEYDAGVLYGIPLGQELAAINQLQVGFAYQNTVVSLVPQYLSNQVNDFVTRHGTHFQELDMKVGYSRDSRDKSILPTVGSFQTLFLDGFAPLSKDSVSFYTLNYQGKWYQPLNEDFIFLTRANFGYGNGLHGAHDFPFFRNYFAGGIDTVRGYQGYTLGPLDSSGSPFGGNILTDASLSLIFPNYISDNVRTSVFMDAGNVYSTLNNRNYGGQSTNSGPIRLSTGVDLDWLTPFGPVELSLAQPLNRRPHDQRETFQFALGANF